MYKKEEEVDKILHYFTPDICDFLWHEKKDYSITLENEESYDDWEITKYVESKFNRNVIYPGFLFHTASYDMKLYSMENARVVLATFYTFEPGFSGDFVSGDYPPT